METTQMYSNVEIVNDFTDWLRNQLKVRKLSVARLAKMSGIHYNTIHNYISNRCEPTMFHMLCLINALGYDLGVIKR